MGRVEERRADNPRSYFRFGESGVPLYDSANGFVLDVEWTGGLVFGEPSLVGDGDSAMRNNASVVATNAANGFNVPAFTVEVVYKPTQINSGGNTLVSHDRFGGTNVFRWRLAVDGATGKVYVYYMTPALEYVSHLSEITVTVGNTYDLAMSYDGSRFRFYRDGEQVGPAYTGTMRASVDAISRFQVGGLWDQTTGELGRGVYDEVAFYPVALSDNRIRAHYLGSSLKQRFYIPSSGTQYQDRPVMNEPLLNWTGTSGVNLFRLPPVPSNTGGATLATLGSTGQTRRTRMMAFYTDTMETLGLAGARGGVVRAAATGENWLGNNSRGLALQVRVVNNDISVVKGVLLPLADGVKSTTGGTYIRTLTADLVPQLLEPTDRLLVEIGAYHGPDGTGAGEFYMYPGNDSDSASDMAFTQGGSASGRQWIELALTPADLGPAYSLYLGNTAVDKLYLGNTQVDRLYLGNTEII